MANKSRKQELTERIEQRLKELEELMLWIAPIDDYDELFNNCQKEAQSLKKELETLKQI